MFYLPEVGKAKLGRGSRTILVWNDPTTVMWEVLPSRVDKVRLSRGSKTILMWSNLRNHVSHAGLFRGGKTMSGMEQSAPRCKSKVLGNKAQYGKLEVDALEDGPVFRDAHQWRHFNRRARRLLQQGGHW